MPNNTMTSITLALAIASGIAHGGVLSHNDPSAFNPGQVAQFSSVSWGATMYSNDVGTVVNPDYTGATAMFIHTKGTNGQLQNTNVTCTNDGSTGSLPTDDLEEDNIAGIPYGDYWRYGTPFGVYTQSTFLDCNINFGAMGEVTDGWGKLISFGSTYFVLLYSFTPPRFEAFFDIRHPAGQGGDTCLVQDMSALQAHGAAAYELIAAGGSFGPGAALSDAVVASDAGLAIGNCLVKYLVPMAMGQCDPALPSVACETGSAKAVPVPALASAVMGLGLAGITWMMGRRRDRPV